MEAMEILKLQKRLQTLSKIIPKLENDQMKTQQQNDNFQVELQTLKQELEKVNHENHFLKQQLHQIPLLEQKQMFALEMQRYQSKIEDLHTHLTCQKEELDKVVQENSKLQQQIQQLSHSKPSQENSELKMKESQYQKNINSLEESVVYFVKRHENLLQENHDLRMKLNESNTENSNIRADLKIKFQEVDKLKKITEFGSQDDVKQQLQDDKAAKFLFQKNSIDLCEKSQKETYLESSSAKDKKPTADKEVAD